MATTTATQETKGFYKLSWVQRIGFGAGDLAQNLIYQTICMYLLFFYTDVYVLGGDAAKCRNNVPRGPSRRRTLGSSCRNIR